MPTWPPKVLLELLNRQSARMIRFTEAEHKNLHMTHVDELPILQGAIGTEVALEALNTAFTKVAQTETVPLNVKWDGAPAVYVGWHPDTEDDTFIMALKSLFSKKPKIIQSKEDIDEYYSDKPDLHTKLLTTWEVLNRDTDFIPKGEIWQGDFLFTKEDLQEVKIDGEPFLAFQPNTIFYAIKQDSEIGQEIQKADVGIVWHTRYRGYSLETMSSSFDIKQEHIKEVKGLWSTTVHTKYEGEPIEIDTTAYETLYSRAVSLNGRLSAIDDYYMKAMEKRTGLMGGALAMQINAMLNEYIREDALDQIDPSKGDELLIRYLENKYSNRRANFIQKGKKDSEVRAVDREYERMLSVIQENEDQVREAIRTVLQLQQVLHQMKMIILNALNQMASQGGVIRTFLAKRDDDSITLEPASHEGFVITTSEGIPLKFVDREQFSKANFSPAYAKGWEH